MSAQSVLIIGTVWVEPNSSAAGVRMLQLIELFLSQHWKVEFASTAAKSNNAIDLKKLGVDEVEIQLNNTSFDKYITELHPTIVVFDRFMVEEQFGWRVAENCPNAVRILDTEDLHSLRKTREAAHKKSEAFSIDSLLQSDIAKREIASILRCDISLIISAFEMKLLQDTFKLDKSLLHHLPFMLNRIEDENIQQWKTYDERQHFTIIGNFMHAPNVDAVLLLKKRIWKQIRQKIPTAELHVYGAYPTQQILQLNNPTEGFLIKGYTTSPEEVVQSIRVVLAPLQFGAGIKGKLTEAMICGAPSVTTSIGAEGMHAKLPWNGCVTDDFDDFSTKAIALYTDEINWKKAQQNGIEIINTLYDKNALGITLIDSIEDIQHKLTNHRTNNFMGGLIQHQTLQSTKYMSKWIEVKNNKL